MQHTRRWPARAVAVAVVVATMAAACSSGDQKSPQADSPAAVAEAKVTPDSIAAVAKTVPDQPADAAVALVDLLVHADDATDAASATGEILRRSGIPIVSTQGDVVAMPDQFVLPEAAVYAELLGSLTASVRQGVGFRPDQARILLEDLIFGEGVIGDGDLVATLGRWGKAANVSDESRFAAAAVRALSGDRGDVLYRGADLTSLRLDALQMTLVVGHLSSSEREQVAGGGGGGGGDSKGRVQGQTAKPPAGPCDKLYDKLNPEGMNAGTKVVNGELKGFVKDAVIDELKETLLDEAQRTALKQALEKTKADELVSKGTAILNVVLLLLGAQLEVNDDKGATTHFKHEKGDRSRHITFTAAARFDSTIANDKIKCYALAGVEVPPNGPLEGWRVRWSLSGQPSVPLPGTVATGELQFLRPAKGEATKLEALAAHPSQLTDGNGKNSFEAVPRVELSPGEGLPLKGRVVVEASLDLNELPFELQNLVDLAKEGRKMKIGADGNPYKVALDKTIELALHALKRAGLPTVRHPVTVEYHGVDIYAATGRADANVLFATVPFFLSVYSCTGIKGPWKGRGGIDGIDAGVFLQASDSLLGRKDSSAVQDKAAINEAVEFALPEDEGTTRVAITDYVNVDVIINTAPSGGLHLNSAIGKVRLVGPEGAITTLGELFGFATSFPVEGYPEHPECPNANEYEYDSL